MEALRAWKFLGMEALRACMFLGMEALRAWRPFGLFSRVHATLCHYVGPLVSLSIITSHFWVFKAERRVDLNHCSCPAAILPLPTRT